MVMRWRDSGILRDVKETCCSRIVKHDALDGPTYARSLGSNISLIVPPPFAIPTPEDQSARISSQGQSLHTPEKP